MAPQNVVTEQQTEFDYSQLQPKTAEWARDIALRVRETVRQGISVIISVGKDLIEVKQQLPHGQFAQWIELEFGWTRRTVENFMNVAVQFGDKSEIISHLDIAPTAAYMLAAPSTPSAAREEVIHLAQKGERITSSVVKEVVTQFRKKSKSQNPKPIAKERLTVQLKLMLHRIRDRWAPDELDLLGKALVQFADSLSKVKNGQAKRKAERR
jgi:hypothetical protein